jgi:gluconate kinase
VAGGAVLACSALKQAYRELLLEHVQDQRVIFLDLPRASAEQRLIARRGYHPFVRDFQRLLDGQYRDLEPPSQALHLTTDLPLDDMLNRAAAYVQGTA